MKKLLPIILILALTSCKVPKYLNVLDGSKSDGTITMYYTYDAFEVPVVQWATGLTLAKQKCASWGYKSAEFFGGGTQECIGVNQYGQCIRWRVTYKCQCTD